MTQPALDGDLAQFQPAEVLQFMRLAQATGRLEISRPGGHGVAETADIFFENGRPVFAQISGLSVRTGDLLIHRGQATAAAVEEALEAQRRAPGLRIGQALRAAGAASPEDVARAVHDALKRILYGVLLWREGRFRFLPGERAGADDLSLELDLDRLILEGLRLADQARAAG